MSNLFIIAAPSGCGKTTLVDALLKNSEHLYLSVTHTTRKPRAGEVDGVNYHFISKTDFKKMILNREFIEHAEVFGNLYGSSREKIQENLNKNIDVILEIIGKELVKLKQICLMPLVFLYCLLQKNLYSKDLRVVVRMMMKQLKIECLMQKTK